MNCAKCEEHIDVGYLHTAKFSPSVSTNKFIDEIFGRECLYNEHKHYIELGPFCIDCYRDYKFFVTTKN